MAFRLRGGCRIGGLPARPKGKFPYIEDRGAVIGDSSFIIDYLKATYGDKLGENRLKPEQRAIGLSMRRMLEEHLYWVIVYLHWMEDACWEMKGVATRGQHVASKGAA